MTPALPLPAGINNVFPGHQVTRRHFPDRHITNTVDCGQHLRRDSHWYS